MNQHVLPEEHGTTKVEKEEEEKSEGVTEVEDEDGMRMRMRSSREIPCYYQREKQNMPQIMIMLTSMKKI